MIAFVGNNFANLVINLGLLKVQLRFVNAIFNGRWIDLVAIVDFRSEDDFRIKLDRMFRLVRQMRATIFHPCYATFIIGR